jgi:hypothetical protein
MQFKVFLKHIFYAINVIELTQANPNHSQITFVMSPVIKEEVVIWTNSLDITLCGYLVM